MVKGVIINKKLRYMALKAQIGFDQGTDAFLVGAKACQEALDKLGEAKADLAIVFSSVQYDQEQMLAGVRSVCGDTLLVGASTAGEITTAGPLNKHSVAVMLLKSESIKFYASVGENVAKDARAAGKDVAKKVRSLAGTELKAFVMLPDVLTGNGSDIVRGVLDVLGAHFPVVGGAAGDDFEFKKTYQYLNDKVYSGAVVGLGMTGDFKIGIGVKHGWLPIGTPAKVTRSSGSVLHELDGKPAIKIYEDYFGEQEAATLRSEALARLAITYPLGMRVEGSEEMLIRDPITVDENGSITCAAEVPEGSEIQLMIGSREEAVKVAKVAAENALGQLDGAAPKAILIFNCIARNKLYGEHAGEEISAIQDVLGESVPLLGFYTYGEQAPLGGQVRNIEQCNTVFHNETVVIFVLAD
jgi:hypothetical protein